jgi:5-deoxy-glucuronate isomerase
MGQYNAENLVIHPAPGRDPDLIVHVTPQAAGWETITFQARRLRAGKTWSFQTGHNELALVVLSGTISVSSGRGEWRGLGERNNVFAGLPYALYLPIETSFTVTAERDAEFAVAWVAADQEFAPRLVTPADVTVEIRGGDHATRQINRMLPPGFPCQRLARRQLVELPAAQA